MNIQNLTALAAQAACKKEWRCVGCDGAFRTIPVYVGPIAFHSKLCGMAFLELPLEIQEEKVWRYSGVRLTPKLRIEAKPVVLGAPVPLEEAVAAGMDVAPVEIVLVATPAAT